MFQFGRKKMNERSGIVGNEIDVDGERWPYLTEQLHTRHALYTNHLCWSVLPTFIFSLTIAFL